MNSLTETAVIPPLQHPASVGFATGFDLVNGSSWNSWDVTLWEQILAGDWNGQFGLWVAAVEQLTGLSSGIGQGETFNADRFQEWHMVYDRWCKRGRFESSLDNLDRGLKGRNEAFVWWLMGYQAGWDRCAQLG